LARCPAQMLAALALLGCADPKGPPAHQASGDGTEDSAEVGWAAALGCRTDAGAFADLAVAETAIPTVPRISWQSDADAPGWVAFRTPEGRLVEQRPSAATRGHDRAVVGLPPDAQIDAIALMQGPDGPLCSAPLSLVTGPLDPAIPAFDKPLLDGSLLDGGYILVPVVDPTGGWMTILDDQGRMVWWWRLEAEWIQGNRPIFRIRLAPDGDGLIANTQSEGIEDPGTLTWVGWTGETRLLHAVPGMHTDFVLLPDGRALSLGWTTREYEGARRILGDTVLELRPGEEARVLWDGFAHFAPDLSVRYPRGYLPANPDLEDWTHANGISYDADQDLILVSIPGIEGLVAIDRQTGAQRYVLAAREAGVEMAGDDDLIHQPHSVAPIDGGLLIFNRNDWAGGTDCSEAVDLALDLEGNTATQTWAYSGPDCQHVAFLGNAERLQSGGTLVCFSSAGVLDLADPSGQTAWRLGLPAGAALGFATAVPRLQ
jgi:hypothetical protein